MLQEIRKSLTAYVASHKAEVRFFCFLIALAVVVAAASNIEDFVNGFLDGASAVTAP